MDSRSEMGREIGKDDDGMPSSCRPVARAKRRPRGPARPQLLTRGQLDGRTAAAKSFDALVVAIENDLGGPGALSAIERSLVEAFVGSTIILQNLNARVCLGQEIDITDLSHSISSMVRVASRLGEQRRARDVSARRVQFALVVARRSGRGRGRGRWLRARSPLPSGLRAPCRAMPTCWRYATKWNG